MIIKRALLVTAVLVSLWLIIFGLVLTASAAPACTCIRATATRNVPGGVTYTVIITGSSSSWYDVIQSPAGPLVAGPSMNRVFSNVTLQPSATYAARVSDSQFGQRYGSTGCMITLLPNAVTIESIAAVPNVPGYVALGVIVMLLGMAIVGAWALRMARR